MTNYRNAFIKGAVLLLATGCGSSPGAGGDGGTGDAGLAVVQIFSWWTAPGEAEALDALLKATKEKNPTLKITNLVAQNIGTSNDDNIARLFGLTDGGVPNPPDVVQYGQETFKGKWSDRGVKFVSLDELAVKEGWATKFRADVLNLGKVDGHLVYLPIGMHRQNGLFYNKQMLTTAQATVPTNWATFVTACDKITA